MNSLLLTLIYSLIIGLTAFGQNFIYSNNGKFYKKGQTIQLRGVNLWAYDDEYPNPEFPYDYNYYANEFNQASFSEIRNSFCFNVIRLNMDFRYFESDANPGVYLQAGWEWLDEKIDWAKNNNVYLILDMHTPQGGYQSYGFNGKFWGNTIEDINNRTRFINLWKTIANRYKNDTTIAGYDLINEPLPLNNLGYWTLIQQTANEIRSVDNNHLLIIEEAFVNDFKWQTINDNNYCIDFHFYNPWDYVANVTFTPYNYASLEEDMLDYGLQFALTNNTPLNIGEYGIKRQVVERSGSNWEKYLNELHNLFDKYQLSHQIWNYHATEWGLHEPYNNSLPSQNNINTNLYSYYVNLCHTNSINVTNNSLKNIIYPNPAHSCLYFDRRYKVSEVIIYNALGQRVLNQSPSKENIIDISMLTKGIYCIKVISSIGTINQKLIKQ